VWSVDIKRKAQFRHKKQPSKTLAYLGSISPTFLRAFFALIFHTNVFFLVTFCEKCARKALVKSTPYKILPYHVLRIIVKKTSKMNCIQSVDFCCKNHVNFKITRTIGKCEKNHIRKTRNMSRRNIVIYLLKEIKQKENNWFLHY